MSSNSKDKVVDRRIYNELDDLAAEILTGEGLLKYMEARRSYFSDSEEAVKKYFSDTENAGGISTFGDFYYNYMSEYSKGYLYKIGEEGYTDGFRELLQRYELDPDIIDVNWKSIKEKEKYYEVDLVDILYSLVNYEIGKHGFTLFGINMGFESIIYFIVREDSYNKRIKKKYELLTLFDLEFLENIYNEIYEVTGDLGDPKIKIGDFLEKKEKDYSTIFKSRESNTVLKNLKEEDEEKLKLIL